MSSPRVVIIRNPLQPLEREIIPVTDGTPIIDVLQDVAPDGFGMPIELYVNMERVEVIDSDRPLRNGEVCAVCVRPGDGGVSLATMIITQLVMTAISLAVSLLFAPKPPKSQRGPNPTYDIGASRNQARLGEPVPVNYGEVLLTPDFASAPYTFYSRSNSDDQYVDQLFCLGCGEFEPVTSTDIVIGDTASNFFPAGTVAFRQFQKSGAVAPVFNHNEQMGPIRNGLWNNADFGQGEHPFQENVYTAPEVTDFEFKDDQTTSTSVQTYPVDITVTGNSPGGNSLVQIRIPSDASVTQGRVINITGTAFDGAYYITSAANDLTSGTGVAPDIVYSHVLLQAVAPAGVTPVDGPATITLTVNVTSSNAQTGWYAAQPLGKTVQDISNDFLAPQGLYKAKSNSGTRVYLDPPYVPTFEVEAQEIDPTTGQQLNTATPGSGFYLKQTVILNAKVPDAIRRTFFLNETNVVTKPAGTANADWKGRAYVVRITAKYTILDNQRYAQKVLWTALKGAISSPPITEPVYGNVTLLAVRMRATNGISGQAQNQLKVKVKRRYKLQDGSVGVSANPVDVIHDIYTDPEHGFGRPQDEIDMATLTEIRPLWGATSGPSFNGVFSQDITGWEALEDALMVAVAKPAIDAGQLTIVADKKKPFDMFSFNDMSIARDSYQASFTLDNSNETDGVEIEYRDPVTFDPSYVTHPDTATIPQRLVYFGLTDKDYALKLAKLYWNRRRYQRNNVTFSTEMQGMVPSVGDRICVSSPVLISGVSGRVIRIIESGGNTIVTLDKTLDWKIPVEITFTQQNMKPTARYSATRGATANEAIITGAIAETLDLSLSRTPASYDAYLGTNKPRSMIITGVTHNGGTAFTIKAVSYPDDNTVTGENPLFVGGPEHLTLDWDGTPL